MRNILDVYKYLDKNGLKRLIEKIKNHDYHWTGTHAEYEAQKDNIPAYAILHFTDDYDDSVGVVDKIEDNNMNGVTSNAVYDALKVTTGIATANVTNLLSVPMSHMALERSGKVVKASLRWYKDPLDTSMSLPGGTPVCTIPAGFRPVDDGRALPLGIQWNATSYLPVQFYMQRDGILRNGNEVTLDGRADLYCESVWMTNDEWPSN